MSSNESRLHEIDKATYKKWLSEARTELLEAQFDLKSQSRFPVLILISGIEGAGKGESVKLLMEILDPREIHVATLDRRGEDARARPPAWSYWQHLPGKGRIAVLFGNWHSEVINHAYQQGMDDDDWNKAMEELRHYERSLCDDGALVLKFWFHLSKQDLKKRIKHLQNDEEQAWRVAPVDMLQVKHYDQVVALGAKLVSETQSERAPWYVIECHDARYRAYEFLSTIKQRLTERLAEEESPPIESDSRNLLPLIQSIAPDTLGQLALSHHLEKDDYKHQLLEEQGRLAALLRDKRMKKKAVVLAFEGNDAAGKGGSIRRVTDALDPRQYQIVPVSTPTKEELAQPFLWRFWKHIPALGGFTVFDRTWYGRVLVERVEGYAKPEEWQRAYTEINEFERQLIEANIIVVKFWLAIDKNTQLERFRAREDTPYKRYKITEDDWRNREKWDDYVLAVNDMVALTSTEHAPWTIIEANDKRYARVKVVRTVNDAIERALNS